MVSLRRLRFVNAVSFHHLKTLKQVFKTGSQLIFKSQFSKKQCRSLGLYLFYSLIKLKNPQKNDTQNFYFVALVIGTETGMHFTNKKKVECPPVLFLFWSQNLQNESIFHLFFNATREPIAILLHFFCFALFPADF